MVERVVDLPKIILEVAQDLSPPKNGFLWLKRRQLRAKYPDGSESGLFEYDEVERRALDAAVIVAHFRDEQGNAQVYLRSALRPPIAFSGEHKDAKTSASGGLWELPAGLIEPGEEPAQAAARELFEELGFQVELLALQALGHYVYPAPGFVAERQFFYAVAVQPAERREPALDGSALERDGVVVTVTLQRALAMCRAGLISDSKTELGLRRLEDELR